MILWEVTPKIKSEWYVHAFVKEELIFAVHLKAQWLPLL